MSNKECVICGNQLENIETNFNGSEWVCPKHTEQQWAEWCIISEYIYQLTPGDFEDNCETIGFQSVIYHNSKTNECNLFFLSNGQTPRSNFKKIFRFPNRQDFGNSEFVNIGNFFDQCFEEFLGKRAELIHQFLRN